MFEFDMFGHPIDPRRGLHGRPRHLPTIELRQRVSQLHAQGLSHLDIAAEIGISAPTLRLNYPAELESRSQTWRRRAEADPKS